MKKFTRMFVVFVALFALPALAHAYKVGDRGKAPWGGKMYPAEITKINGNQCFIHWYQESGTFDEWKACTDFIPDGGAAPAAPASAYSEGDAVMVEWKGSWWPARVLKAKSDSWLIHYDGYASSWDEWVGPSRIRKK